MGLRLLTKTVKGTTVVSPNPDLQLRFYGHACIGVFVDDEPLLVIDPFDRGAFPEQTTLDGPPDIFPYVIATHEHADHCAFSRVGGARVLGLVADAELRVGGMSISGRHASHDEFGGRLRGGATTMLDLRFHGLRILHAGDLGERLCGSALDWLLEPKCDALIVPAGGYFTIGADAALELIDAAAPRHAVFVHCRDQGIALPELLGTEHLRQRARGTIDERDVLELRAEAKRGAEAFTYAPPKLLLLRPQR